MVIKLSSILQPTAQAQELMKENEQLCIEVEELKQKLVNLELMNGGMTCNMQHLHI